MTTLRIDQSAVRQVYGTPAVEFVLNHMLRPALKALHLKPGFASGNEAVRAFCGFLRRSEPSALEIACLSFSAMSIDFDLNIEALALMPSLANIQHHGVDR